MEFPDFLLILLKFIVFPDLSMDMYHYFKRVLSMLFVLGYAQVVV